MAQFCFQKEGNKEEHLCPGPRLTSGISFFSRSMRGSSEQTNDRWIGSSAE